MSLPDYLILKEDGEIAFDVSTNEGVAAFFEYLGCTAEQLRADFDNEDDE